MKPSNRFTKSASVLDPRVRKLVEDLENVLERLANPNTRAELEKFYRPNLNAQQIEEIVSYQLHLIVPDDPTLPNIQPLLANIRLNGELRYKKHAPTDQTPLKLPRSIIFLCDAKGNLVSGAFTLSKNQHGTKPDEKMRIISSGSSKNLKQFVLISNVVRMARLQVPLGLVIHTGQTFEAELNDPNCEWNTFYRSIIAEIDLVQRFNNPLIDRPRIGNPYVITKRGKSSQWVVNIHDELAARLSLFNYNLHLPMSIIFSLTNDEQKTIRKEQAAGIVPTLVRKFIGDILKGCKLMHDANIIHRDLKPDNMLIDRDSNGKPYVKICDFGMAVDLREAKYYFDLLSRLVGLRITLDNEVIKVSYAKSTIELLCKIPKYAEILKVTTPGGKIDLENVRVAGTAIIEDLINEYAALTNHDPNILKELRMEPPTLQTVNKRLAMIRYKLLPEAHQKYFKLEIEEPLTTFEYSSPEILKLHINHQSKYNDEFKKFEKRYKDEKYEPIAISDLDTFDNSNTGTKIVAATRPEKSQDIYAIGICIFELLYGRRPGIRDIVLIDSNPLLTNLLQPSTYRSDIDEAIKNWRKWQDSFTTETTLQDTQSTTTTALPLITEQVTEVPTIIVPRLSEDLKRKQPAENFSTPPKRPRLG